MALIKLNVIMLKAIARTPTKPKATAPILASQLDHLASHQLSFCDCCSGKPPDSALAILEAIIVTVVVCVYPRLFVENLIASDNK